MTQQQACKIAGSSGIGDCKRRSPEHYQKMAEINRKNRNASFEQRFWERVNKTQTCWNWTGFKDRSGYGQVSFHAKISRAHRVSWIICRGEIPDNLWVLHKCDNPCCVNPEHLYVGTQKQNIQDAVDRKRYRSGESHHWYGKFGENSVTSKYSDESYNKAKKMRIETGATYREISEKCGIPIASIHRFCNSKDGRRH